MIILTSKAVKSIIVFSRKPLSSMRSGSRSTRFSLFKLHVSIMLSNSQNKYALSRRKNTEQISSKMRRLRNRIVWMTSNISLSSFIPYWRMLRKTNLLSKISMKLRPNFLTNSKKRPRTSPVNGATLKQRKLTTKRESPKKETSSTSIFE